MILLSWDGTRPDYLERVPVPAFERIRADGLVAERLTPVFPANTFPNHVSIATGTFVDRHGIVANVFQDRERGEYRYSADASWIEAEPIWVAAERQGVRAASFFWVGSETDWRGTGASYRRTPFDGSIPESEKVAQILEWVDLPDGERPGLILSWWHGCDSVGHRWGPDHERVGRQLAAQGEQLAVLLNGLDERDAWSWTTLILLSDHGMAPVSESIDLRGRLRERGLRARVAGSGGFAHVYLERPEDAGIALGVLRGIDGIRAVRGPGIPPEHRAYHPKRTGDVVVFTDPPHAFVLPTLAQRLWIQGAGMFGGVPGLHGYDPDLPEMAAILLAIGRGVPAGGRIGPRSVVDIAPTVARLLGIEPPRDSEGVAIPQILP